MILFVTSAALVGLLHSLAPGHWLPVVLLSRSQNWTGRAAVFAALVASSGHILVSGLFGLLVLALGTSFAATHGETVEHYGALAVAAFGLGYAAYTYFRHSRCHGHEHHGPVPGKQKAPYLFLFSLGLSPCVAVFPVLAAAAPVGAIPVGLTVAGFAAGVILALVGATLLVGKGIWKLDHPILEHYGDVIAGLAVAAMGVLLFLFPGASWLHLD